PLHPEVVLLADVFQDLAVRRPINVECNRPRLRVSAGIVDGRLVVERHQIGTRKAFDHMKLFRMWITVAIDPGSFIESHHVDHKSIALPMTDRMAGPG